MKRALVTSLAAMLLCLSAVSSSNAYDRAPTGRFIGCVLNNGDLVPVETILVDQSQALGGTYVFLEGNARINGTLEHLAVNGGSYSMVWEDKYGSGELVIQFSADTNRFSGRWSSHGDGAVNDTADQTWSGKRSQKPLDQTACDDLVG